MRRNSFVPVNSKMPPNTASLTTTHNNNMITNGDCLRSLMGSKYRGPIQDQITAMLNLLQIGDEFFQDYAELQSHYSEELMKLQNKYRSEVSSETQRSPPKVCNAGAEKLLNDILEVCDTEAQIYAECCRKMKAKVCDPLRLVVNQKKNQLERLHHFRSGMENMLISARELTMKCQQNCSTVYGNQRGKYDNKLIPTVLNAHNQYVLQLHATNSLITEYSAIALPQVMDELETMYSECGKVVRALYSLYQGTVISKNENIITCVKSRHDTILAQCDLLCEDLRQFIKQQQKVQSEESKFSRDTSLGMEYDCELEWHCEDFMSPYDDCPELLQRSELIWDRLTEEELNAKLASLKKEFVELSSYIHQNMDVIETLRAMSTQSASDKSVENVCELQDDIYRKDTEVREATVQLAGVSAQIDLITMKRTTRGASGVGETGTGSTSSSKRGELKRGNSLAGASGSFQHGMLGNMNSSGSSETPPGGIPMKGLWRRALSSLKRDKSIKGSNVVVTGGSSQVRKKESKSNVVIEKQPVGNNGADIDPVYHLLRSAATKTQSPAFSAYPTSSSSPYVNVNSNPLRSDYNSYEQGVSLIMKAVAEDPEPTSSNVNPDSTPTPSTSGVSGWTLRKAMMSSFRMKSVSMTDHSGSSMTSGTQALPSTNQVLSPFHTSDSSSHPSHRAVPSSNVHATSQSSHNQLSVSRPVGPLSGSSTLSTRPTSGVSKLSPQHPAGVLHVPPQGTNSGQGSSGGSPRLLTSQNSMTGARSPKRPSLAVGGTSPYASRATTSSFPMSDVTNAPYSGTSSHLHSPAHSSAIPSPSHHPSISSQHLQSMTCNLESSSQLLQASPIHSGSQSHRGSGNSSLLPGVAGMAASGIALSSSSGSHISTSRSHLQKHYSLATEPSGNYSAHLSPRPNEVEKKYDISPGKHLSLNPPISMQRQKMDSRMKSFSVDNGDNNATAPVTSELIDNDSRKKSTSFTNTNFIESTLPNNPRRRKQLYDRKKSLSVEHEAQPGTRRVEFDEESLLRKTEWRTSGDSSVGHPSPRHSTGGSGATVQASGSIGSSGSAGSGSSPKQYVRNQETHVPTARRRLPLQLKSFSLDAPEAAQPGDGSLDPGNLSKKKSVSPLATNNENAATLFSTQSSSHYNETSFGIVPNMTPSSSNFRTRRPEQPHRSMSVAIGGPLEGNSPAGGSYSQGGATECFDRSRPNSTKISYLTTQTGAQASGSARSPQDNRRDYRLSGNLYIVLYDFTARHKSELDLRSGWKVSVMDARDPEWWSGMCNGRVGYFPSSYVQRIRQGDQAWRVLVQRYVEPLNRHELSSSERTRYSLKLFRGQIVVQDGPEDENGCIPLVMKDGTRYFCPLEYLQKVTYN